MVIKSQDSKRLTFKHNLNPRFKFIIQGVSRHHYFVEGPFTVMNNSYETNNEGTELYDPLTQDQFLHQFLRFF